IPDFIRAWATVNGLPSGEIDAFMKLSDLMLSAGKKILILEDWLYPSAYGNFCEECLKSPEKIKQAKIKAFQRLIAGLDCSSLETKLSNALEISGKIKSMPFFYQQVKENLLLVKFAVLLSGFFDALQENRQQEARAVSSQLQTTLVQWKNTYEALKEMTGNPYIFSIRDRSGRVPFL
ncbi:MAG: hypothetical protein PHV82_18240, partial [Victivallaceae bacterium]|nr:hypothetical protein [Victivallaceae bacterium]